MKILMHRHLSGTAHSSLEVNEEVLNDVNKDLANSYVIANNLSETPRIESVEKLEQLLKEYQSYGECTNDYNILCKFYVKEDGTLSTDVRYESLYAVTYELITDYLFDEPFELGKYKIIDYNFEVKE